MSSSSWSFAPVPTHRSRCFERSRCTPWRLAVFATVAALLAACAGGPEPREDDGPARRAAEKAYRPAEQAATRMFEETWIVDGRGVDIVLDRPDHAGPLPVVVYLPGLGESRSAGAQWRQAWARAGYAVLSVQALDDDATAWQSDLARNGEFRALGRKHFSASMMSLRIRALQSVVDEGRRRQSATGWQGLDWNVVALAGYDLGAYAAMAAAGEHVGPDGGPIAFGSRSALRAIVVLSPFASIANSDAQTRYRDVRTPLLAITSDTDGDPLGSIADPAQRLAPFDHVASTPAWLLSLNGMPHDGLAGNAAFEISRANAAQAEHDRNATDGQQRQRGSGRRGGPNNLSDDAFGPGGASGRARPVPGSGRDAPGLSRIGLQWRVDAARDVSTAFLDAALRGDARAKAWLATDARDRLASIGELRSK